MRERSFLFTDIEGSSRLWERYPKEMWEALQIHDQLIQSVVEVNQGRVFKTVGDAVCAVFDSVGDAIEAAGNIHRELSEKEWPTPAPLVVRMAIHAGEVEERNGDFFAPPLNRLARIVDLAHGRQVICSERIASLFPDKATLLESVPLRGLSDPERVYQLDLSESPAQFPPLRVGGSIHRAGNIPSAISPIIGREEELERLGVILRTGRMATVSGPGGIGKTRVALAHCEKEATKVGSGHYSGGVWCFELTKITDPAHIVPSLLRVMGLHRKIGSIQRLHSFPHSKDLRHYYSSITASTMLVR